MSGFVRPEALDSFAEVADFLTGAAFLGDLGFALRVADFLGRVDSTGRPMKLDRPREERRSTTAFFYVKPEQAGHPRRDGDDGKAFFLFDAWLGDEF